MTTVYNYCFKESCANLSQYAERGQQVSEESETEYLISSLFRFVFLPFQIRSQISNLLWLHHLLL